MTAVHRGGLAASAVLAAIGSAALVGGLGYGVTVEGGEIGPGFLPAMAGGLVAVFAVLDLVGRLRRRPDRPSQAELILDTRSRPDDGIVLGDPLDPGAPTTSTQSIHSPLATDDDDGVDILGRTQRQRNRMLAVVLGLVVVTLAMVQVVGFLLAFVLLLFVVAVFVEHRRVLPSALVAVAAGVVTYAIFVALLRVPLPQGLLGLI
ncbi:tripartite tricarboxylate transporter TctB family protein [Frigoribacterium sp. CFBP9039]|uniref:tripartite tricarboxylate transporter TctB family protein n=1 Tax=Frigoribacterium sp. CFBP9029 TaxID=3096541 RepID=UPI002A69C375|nr:tripartite tricarboxylate transporter TctB family protein [Frigoribacterium sp. CFBP9039]MDY0946059.1 tripartite tricarboxylate transporter TctB family protein [Frigoribacterium sp. CFBP9039]